MEFGHLIWLRLCPKKFAKSGSCAPEFMKQMVDGGQLCTLERCNKNNVFNNFLSCKQNHSQVWLANYCGYFNVLGCFNKPPTLKLGRNQTRRNPSLSFTSLRAEFAAMVGVIVTSAFGTLYLERQLKASPKARKDMRWVGLGRYFNQALENGFRWV